MDIGAGYTGLTIDDTTTGFLALRTSGTTKLVLSANGNSYFNGGNVGIGTTGPVQNLHIVNTDGANIILNSNTGAENNGVFMTEGGVATPYVNGAYVHYDSTNNIFKINTGAASLATRFEIARDTGAIRFNSYDSTNLTGTPTYMLGTDGSGNVVKVLGGDIPGGGGTVTGTGTAGTVTKWNSAGTGIEDGPITFSGNNSTFAGNITFGDSHFIGDDASDNLLIQSSAGENIIIDSLDETLFRINGSTKIQIKSSGNVGIGVTGPVKKLQVSDSATGLMTNLLLTNTHDTNGDTAGISFSMTDNDLYNKAGIVFERTTNQGIGKLYLCNNNTGDSSNFTLADAAITIIPNRNVGIGTTSPVKKLVLDKSNSGGAGAYIRVQNEVGGVGSNVGVDFATFSPEFYSTTSLDPVAQIRATDISSYSGRLDILVRGQGTAGILSTVATFDRSGNVGIGTTSPFTNLEIEGSGLDSIIRLYTATGAANIRTWEMRAVGVAGEGLLFRQVNDANTVYTNRMILDNSGNVGIGTTSPGAKLEIVDTSNPGATSGSVIIEGRRDGSPNVLTLRAKDASAPAGALPNGQGPVVRFQGFDGTDFENMGYIQVAADGQAVANGDAPSFMAFGTSADGSSSPTEKMRIEADGTVLIGTTSSGYDTTQGYPLHAMSDLTSQSYISVARKGQTSGTEGLIMGLDTSNAYLLVRDNIPLILGTNNLSHVFIKPSGYVGINTSTPRSRLQVAGGIQMADDTDTASADKVGTMRYRTGTEYVEVTGTELVTNGDFSSTANWSKDRRCVSRYCCY